jgi:hypothetical protein
LRKNGGNKASFHESAPVRFHSGDIVPLPFCLAISP